MFLMLQMSGSLGISLSIKTYRGLSTEARESQLSDPEVGGVIATSSGGSSDDGVAQYCMNQPKNSNSSWRRSGVLMALERKNKAGILAKYYRMVLCYDM